MDMLQEIFAKQKILQERLGYDFEKMTDSERAAYIKEYAQHADHEMHEMLAEIPFFKSWKKYTELPELNEACWEAAQEEFIDAVHFMVNCALALRFDPELLYYMYVDKNDVNHERQEDHVSYKPCVDAKPQTIDFGNIALATGVSINEVAQAVSEQLQKKNMRGV